MNEEMTLAELAEASATPARTIRFYISRGLLEGPSKAGRGATYTAAHLARLEEIKSLQTQGRTLSDIGRSLSAGDFEPTAPPSPWWHHAVAGDVIVMVNADSSPWRIKQIRSAIEEFTLRLKEPNQ